MRKIIFLIIVFTAIAVHNSYADKLSTVHFSKIIENEGNDLILKGVSLKRVFFMKAFVAGFYLEENVSTDDVFENVSKRIEVSYFVHISKEKLSDYTEDLMQDNVSPQEFKALAGRVGTMREYFVDLKPGDKYALTYIPDMGTKFEYNNEFIGVIKGEDFANGLFATWIGKKPMDQRIKKQILGIAENTSENIFNVVLAQ